MHRHSGLKWVYEMLGVMDGLSTVMLLALAPAWFYGTTIPLIVFFFECFHVWANLAASTQGFLQHLSSSSSWPSDVRKTPPAAAKLACLLLIEMASFNPSLHGYSDEDAREISL